MNNTSWELSLPVYRCPPNWGNFNEMLTTLSAGHLPERQAVVSRFVESVEVHPSHAEVKLKFRLDALTTTFDSYWPEMAPEKETSSETRSPRQVYGWCPQGDSNARTRLRRPVLYPLSYGGQWSAVLAVVV